MPDLATHSLAVETDDGVRLRRSRCRDFEAMAFGLENRDSGMLLVWRSSETIDVKNLGVMAFRSCHRNTKHGSEGLVVLITRNDRPCRY